MTFQVSKPDANDPLADSQSDILNNFVAIQQGNGDFFQDQVVLKEQVADSSEQTDRSIFYAKQDSDTSKTEIYATNEDAGDNPVQLTSEDYLGARGQKGNFSTIKMGATVGSSGTEDLDGNFICRAYGQMSSGGTINTTISKNIDAGNSTQASNPGEYTIVTEDVYQNGNAILIGQAFNKNKSINIETVSVTADTPATGQLTFSVKVWNNNGSLDNSGFQFFILGGMD